MTCPYCLKEKGHYIECPVGADIKHIKASRKKKVAEIIRMTEHKRYSVKNIIKILNDEKKAFESLPKMPMQRWWIGYFSFALPEQFPLWGMPPKPNFD